MWIGIVLMNGLSSVGELLLSLDFLERYDEELKAMNGGKEGRPFALTGSHVVFLAVVRYFFGLPCLTGSLKASPER